MECSFQRPSPGCGPFWPMSPLISSGREPWADTVVAIANCKLGQCSRSNDLVLFVISFRHREIGRCVLSVLFLQIAFWATGNEKSTAGTTQHGRRSTLPKEEIFQAHKIEYSVLVAHGQDAAYQFSREAINKRASPNCTRPLFCATVVGGKVRCTGRLPMTG